MMDVRAIHDDRDLDWALAQIVPYFDKEPERGTPEADRFDVLATLIEAYERKNYELPLADPVDVLAFVIEQLGRSQHEFAQIIGSPSRAFDILNRRTHLNLDNIRAISLAWRLPIAALTSPYELSRNSA